MTYDRSQVALLPKTLVALGALLTLLLVAPQARAADVRATWEPWNGGTSLTFDAELGEDNTVDIDLVGDNYIVTDSTAPVMSGDASCSVAANTATCPAVDIIQIRVHLHDLDDFVDVSSPVYAQMEGGTGADEMLSGGGDDDLSGEGLVVAGSIGGGEGDRIDGRGGNDFIVGDDPGFAGTSGNDTLLGGGGNEIIFAGDGDDVVDAGPGEDGVDDGGGNDTVVLGEGNDQYFGSDSAGNDGISGAGGHDLLRASQTVDGADTLSGGPGTDAVVYNQLNFDPLNPGGSTEETRTVAVDASLDNRANDGTGTEGDDIKNDVETVGGGTSNDSLVGGSGAQTLNGGGGEDYLDGGPDADRLVGGEAADVLRLRDDGADTTAACGPGEDFVIADPADLPDADCEQVDAVLGDRPVGGERIAVEPRGAPLGMLLPARTVPVPLIDHVNLPVETIVDATAGRAKVVSLGPPKRRKRGKRGKRARRRHQRATIWAGQFKLRQGRGRRAATVFELAGGDDVECPDAAAAGAEGVAAGPEGDLARRGKKRKIWVSKRKGKFASAASNGVGRSSRGVGRWLTGEDCRGTLFRSRRGVLLVRDFARRRTVRLTAGKTYLARN